MKLMVARVNTTYTSVTSIYEPDRIVPARKKYSNKQSGHLTLKLGDRNIVWSIKKIRNGV